MTVSGYMRCKSPCMLTGVAQGVNKLHAQGVTGKDIKIGM